MIFKYLIIVVTLFAMILFGCSTDNNLSDSSSSDKQLYIVKFLEDSAPQLQSTSNNLRRSYIDKILTDESIATAEVVYYYDNLFTACAVYLTNDEYSRISINKNVEYVEQDQIITIDDELIPANKGEQLMGETVSWGTTAVGGTSPATSSTGVAWIVDSGVDLTHPDLNINTTLTKTFVKKSQDSKTANDLNGHGTHCAGIIAAKNNTIGSLGVCAGATVIGVKVLNAQGSGSITDIVNGLNYVAGKLISGKLNVVNLSLGGSANTTLDNAVISLANKGAIIVVAAGNSAKDCSTFSPARVNHSNVYTISAHNEQYKLSSYSNFGAPVDYSAPGDLIYSTYKNNGYATMSGTSMATPHVAGILLANNGSINFNGYITGDKDSWPDKRAVRIVE
ncbi:S8 family peptidase [Candidatus Kapaibacterium sp.]